jgi:anti-sigma regulatory factor (Ser/Thr protein kinase)
VRLHLKVVPHEQGGRLIVRVEDSGAGFDVNRVMAVPYAAHELSGRGLDLVRRLSQHCHWSEDGRTATVEFSWGAQA